MLLAMRGIAKRFGGVEALKGVDFELEAGEVHALVGENGAGKSTLMRILAGALPPDRGAILMEGQPVHFRSVREARGRGVVMVYQELNLAPNLTVAENLFLGLLPPWLIPRRLAERARGFLRELGLDLDPGALAGHLEVGAQQLLALAQALVHRARVLILDEPTAALSAQEVALLFELVRRLKGHGVSVVYISHRLEEVFALADRVTVLRDGQRVLTRPVPETSPEEVVVQMVGARVEGAREAPPPPRDGGWRLEVRAPGLAPLGFHLRPGEILGLAGGVGSGRNLVLEALFGLRGEAFVEGQRIEGVAGAVARGLFLVPEDRKTQGLVLGLPARENLALPLLARLSARGFLRFREEKALVQAWFQRLNVQPQRPDLPAGAFSGGNQQKLLIAKALATGPRILLLQEPTRGVDVRVREEIYRLLHQLAAEGLAILVSSGDAQEIARLAHRCLVFRGGRAVAELSAPLDPKEVVAHVVGAALV